MNKWGKKDVAETIIRFLEDQLTDPWEWGEYLSIQEDDPELEAVRLRCAAIRDKYPPSSETEYCSEAGRRELRRIADQLLAGFE